jgi:hypothetical protein
MIWHALFLPTCAYAALPGLLPCMHARGPLNMVKAAAREVLLWHALLTPT